MVVVGGGAGGIATASSLLRRRPGLTIAIVEPRDTHYYQPGWTLVGGGVFDAHSHPHEQVVNVLDGGFELVVEGTPRMLRTGNVFAIPGNAPHSGRALTLCWILDVFCPIREDYRTA